MRREQPVGDSPQLWGDSTPPGTKPTPSKLELCSSGSTEGQQQVPAHPGSVPTPQGVTVQTHQNVPIQALNQLLVSPREEAVSPPTWGLSLLSPGSEGHGSVTGAHPPVRGAAQHRVGHHRPPRASIWGHQGPADCPQPSTAGTSITLLPVKKWSFQPGCRKKTQN